MEWMLMPFRRYAEFSGRSRRKEFWMFQLLNALVFLILYALILGGGGFDLLAAAGTAGDGAGSDFSEVSFGPVFWIGCIVLLVWALVSLIPSIAVAVRRLHDRNMSGWYLVAFVVVVLVLGMIPVLGVLPVLALELGYIIVMALPGTPGPNQYGPDPLGRADTEVFS